MHYNIAELFNVKNQLTTANSSKKRQRFIFRTLCLIGRQKACNYVLK